MREYRRLAGGIDPSSGLPAVLARMTNAFNGNGENCKAPGALHVYVLQFVNVRESLARDDAAGGRVKHLPNQMFLDMDGVVYMKEMNAASAQLAQSIPKRLGRVVLVQRKGARPRKSPAGVATNDLIFSAGTGSNADMFPSILSLYVPSGSRVADVTFGRGVFWRKVPTDRYELLATDIKKGVDCQSLPYANEAIDCVVFDPPYMHTPGGTAHDGHQNFEQYYQNNGDNRTKLKYHEAVLDLYFRSAAEAWRVLKNGGIYIVKCQDEVCACRQRLTHVEIINHLASTFIAEDIFVLIRNGKPGVSRMIRQRHARKNHSYFLVFRKKPRKTRG